MRIMFTQLLEKYNIPAPRYTSYPTVPYWQEEPPPSDVWKGRVFQAFQKDRGISLYVHLPFCESLCTYCGCNKRITRNHGVEQPYVDTLLREWALYTELLPARPVLRELHLGGGTPTFFSPKELERLILGILGTCELPETYHFSFEAHPSNTSFAHLAKLFKLGFRRLSIGIQDVDDDILRVINRRQTLAEVDRVFSWARKLGYESINADLIYGLPLQGSEQVHRTMDCIAEWRPERIAFYSYAHVPWIKPSQRAYSEEDLPRGAAKRALYELGRERLLAMGYREVGLDHFALPDDSLCRAMDRGELHRNFMGYTPFHTTLSLGLGASAISDSWDAFVQNEKSIEKYRERVDQGEFPILRGHLLSREDQALRKVMLDIMCRMATRWADDLPASVLQTGLERLKPLEKDGLVALEPGRLRVTEAGRPFLRNICLAFDAQYWARQPEGKLFSQVV